MRIRCGIYIRVSTDRQETQNQILELEGYAKRQKDWVIVERYIDEAQSGSRSERPALEKMFEDARRNKFDVLLFWSLDRFSREGVLKTILRLNEIESYGVKFISYTEPYLSSLGAFRDAIVALLAALAKQEQIRTSERVKAGLERAKREGVKLGRPQITLDRNELLHLRENGLSLRQIAQKLGVSKSKVWATIHQNSYLTKSQIEIEGGENVHKT
ncbi:MAG: recombinase family protein [Planctomycetota bacterium]|nr:recombinase family protein [Planctomycetota bacterium]